MRFAILIISLMLVACATASPWQPNFDRAATKANECRTAYDARIIATRVAMVECARPTVEAELVTSGYPHGDLMAVFTAYARAVAEKVDNKEMTDAEADFLGVQMFSSLTDTALQRDYQRSVSQASRASALGQVLQGQAAMQRAYAPRVAPITCTSVGVTVTCR